MAITFVLSLMAIFAFFALSFDAGIWYFDHRWAQTQAEASALAGASYLPATNTFQADGAVGQWLGYNRAQPGDRIF